MSAHLLKSRRRSPASLVLERHAVSQRQLADSLGVSTSTVSRALRGTQPLPEGFVAVIRLVVGHDAAREVLDAIGGDR